MVLYNQRKQHVLKAVSIFKTQIIYFVLNIYGMESSYRFCVVSPKSRFYTGASGYVEQGFGAGAARSRGIWLEPELSL